ncbi:MAG TPA: alpha/beta hydrolase [Gemmatimonadaceae bacterium]|nr:alpha/beta hydrolase [Gemmatimonadaceae bacterium]
MRNAAVIAWLSALAACANERAPEQTERTAGASAAPRSGVVTAGDAAINYEIAGAGTPLVLIHGWAQDLTIWDEQVRAFSPRHRVVRYDRRGYGRSTGHADPTADPDDLRILLDSLGIASAAVLGLSAGSRAALNFAVAFPERVSALVLYGQGPVPGYAPMPEGPDPLMVFREIARTHGLDSLGKLVRAHPLAWMPPDKPELQDSLRLGWARYAGRDLLDPRPPSGRVPEARLDQVAAIRAPTLLLHGDHEMPLFQQVADTLVARIPGARKVVITDGGHGAHFAQPERFNAAVLEFLEAATRQSPPR